MGRFVHRRIISIRLGILPHLGNDMEWFDKFMQLLIKQGAQCSVRCLELLIEIDSIEHTVGFWKHSFSSNRQRYLNGVDLLNTKVITSLYKAHLLPNMEKTLVLTHPSRLATKYGSCLAGLTTAEEVHSYCVVQKIDKHLQDLHEA
jgi:hypothetical protein